MISTPCLATRGLLLSKRPGSDNTDRDGPGNTKAQGTRDKAQGRGKTREPRACISILAPSGNRLIEKHSSREKKIPNMGENRV